MKVLHLNEIVLFLDRIWIEKMKNEVKIFKILKS